VRFPAPVVALCTALFLAGCDGSDDEGTGAGPSGVAGQKAAFAKEGGPEFLAVDGAGDLYVTDCWAARVFVIHPPDPLRVVVGSGPDGFGAGYAGDGGQAARAQVLCPSGIAVDGDGDLFLTDHGNNRIRKVTPDGVISTIAGSGPAGIDRGAYTGDGGPATKARLQEPASLTLGPNGEIYVADRDNNVVRRIDADGVITTVAGSGSVGFSGDGGAAAKAELDGPLAVAVDGDGNLYVADSNNNRVRKVDTEGTITTVAGTGDVGASGDGAPATRAAVEAPDFLVFDREGNLYVSEPDDNLVRRIDPSGTITTVAGTGVPGFSGDGGPAVKAKLTTPTGLAFDGDGSLYVADTGNLRVRRIDREGVITTYGTG
jgi:trimeric autotransporter adhesin